MFYVNEKIKNTYRVPQPEEEALTLDWIKMKIQMDYRSGYLIQ